MTTLNRRMLLASSAGLITQAACATSPRYMIADVWVTGESGQGTAASLEEAFAVARLSNGAPFVVGLMPGAYEEKRILDAPNTTIMGSGPDSVITFGAAAGHTRPNGERWGTSGSATLTIDAPGVTLRNLTVRNSFDYLEDRITGASGGAQAVALAVGREADRTLIENCRVEGYQDTLLLQARTYMRDCVVTGCVDFIFGGAAAYLDRCTIINRAVPGRTDGFIAAPSTPELQPHGFVFSNCRLEREPGVPDGTIHLGRPWRAGGNMSLLGAAAFIDCWMDAHIAREGWTSMGYRGPDGDARQLTPEEARLFERGSTGPGAGQPSTRRRMLSPAIAAAMTPENVLGGWRPTMGGR